MQSTNRQSTNIKENNREAKSVAPDIDFYVVVYPKEESELGDVIFHANVRDIILQAKGGLNTYDVAGVYLDYDEALAQAHKLMGHEGMNKDYSSSELEESILSPNDRDVRDAKELAAETLIAGEDGELDLEDVDDETLAELLQNLVITEKNADRVACEIISVMRETNASDKEIVEALSVHMGLHINEAREVFKSNK